MISLAALLVWIICACCVTARLTAKSNPNEPHICFVVRTYYGHGSDPNSGLYTFINSLQQQEYGNWEMVVLVMDSHPFHNLHQIINEANDPRIWVFAEWISSEYSPYKSPGIWTSGYHNKLYSLTDMAIKACSSHSDWVVVTNGDNEYGKGFTQIIAESTEKYDVVSFDYYSRYQRISGVPCERFAVSPNNPPCKENKMSWCKTDLGATAYSWKRFIDEDMRYENLNLSESFTGQDGFMAQVVVGKGWPRREVHGKCLYDHTPSPQGCARRGMVWDDSIGANAESLGGNCISMQTAKGKMSSQIEAVNVTITTGDLSAFGVNKDKLDIICLRKRGVQFRNEFTRFFNHQCQEDEAVMTGALPNHLEVVQLTKYETITPFGQTEL